jgi:hypothetical protein
VAVLQRYEHYIKEEILARELVVVADGQAAANAAGAFSDTIAPTKLGGHQVLVTLQRLS